MVTPAKILPSRLLSSAFRPREIRTLPADHESKKEIITDFDDCLVVSTRQSYCGKVVTHEWDSNPRGLPHQDAIQR